MSTIKETLLAQVELALKALTELKAVQPCEAFPIALDNVPMPAAFFWDEDEQTTQPLPGLAKCDMRLNIYVFLKLSRGRGQAAFNTLSNTIQGKIEDALVALINPGTGSLWSIGKISLKKNFPNDSLGVMFIEFALIYGHNWGDSSK